MRVRVVVTLVVLAASVAGAGPAGPPVAAAQPPDTLFLVKDEVLPSPVDIALAIADGTFETSARVVISRDDGFADALASGVMQSDAPLLLTPPGGPLPAGVVEELQRLGASEAVVLGGAQAVSPVVEQELRDLGLAVTRRQGGSRLETAIAIAAAEAPDADTVMLARAFAAPGSADPSQAYADTLAAGGVAARSGIPVLLSETEGLSPATRAHLEATPGIRRVIVLGGVAALSQAVEDELVAMGLEVERAAGGSRAGTALEIAKVAGDDSAADAARVIVTEGQAAAGGFAQAGDTTWAAGFALASHAARFDAPIVLALGGTVPAETATFLAGGIGGDPAAGPVLTCAVRASACEDVRVAAGLPPATPPLLASAVDGGTSATCAVVDGGARCWGIAADGRLGVGARPDGSPAREPLPLPVVDASGAPLVGVAQVSAGADHACAAMADGTARCWGEGALGRLGDGQDPASAEDRPHAVAVQGPDGPLSDVVGVSAGQEHSCAVLGDGTAVCWGADGFGKLGASGSGASGVAVPVVTADGGPLQDVTAVAAGGDHTCAIAAARALCWGSANGSQLGDGAEQGSEPAPVEVVGADGPLVGVAGIATSEIRAHTCAVLVDGGVACWGEGEAGQLGDGAAATTPRAVTVMTDAGPLGGAVGISVGATHSCAALADGGAACWGSGESGQLGDGARSGRPVAAVVRAAPGGDPLGDVVAVALGGDRSCALRGDAGVRCWGYGPDGAIGDGDLEDRLVPVTVLAGPPG